MLNYNLFNEELKQLFLLNESTLKPCQHSGTILPMMSFRALCILHEYNGCSINELSKILNVTKQQAFVIVKRLEEEGYLKCEKDPNDKRKVCIYLNEQASELIEQQLSCITGDIITLLKNCSQDTQEKLLLALHNLFMVIQDCKEELQ